jgi:hypothetical protein
VHTDKVTCCNCALDGSVRDKVSANPIIDTRAKNVEFPDRRYEEYTATYY